MLSRDQSEFLKKIKNEDIPVSGLTKKEKEIFRFLKGKEYARGKDIPSTENTPESKHVRVLQITQSGLQYLEQEYHYCLSMECMKEEIEAIRHIAEIAEEKAKSSEEKAKESRKRTNIANMISAAALLVSIISLFMD